MFLYFIGKSATGLEVTPNSGMYAESIYMCFPLLVVELRAQESGLSQWRFV